MIGERRGKMRTERRGEMIGEGGEETINKSRDEMPAEIGEESRAMDGRWTSDGRAMDER